MMIANKELVLVRKDEKPNWVFRYDSEEGKYIHEGTKNTYALFFSDPVANYKPFWIGMKAPMNDKNSNVYTWVTVEYEIGADHIDFLGSRLSFT